MVKTRQDLLHGLSAAELKRMIVAKQKIEKLETTQTSLLGKLAKVEKEIAKLLAGGAAKAPRKKVGKKRAAKRKTVKKTAKKKVVAKRAKKKTSKKPVRKVPRRKAGTGARLEDVIIQVLKAAGKEMSYPDIKATIASEKLYKSKSKNFDNVLRRTISTAKGLKRVGRGVYAVK
jgi:hypothetical protein